MGSTVHAVENGEHGSHLLASLPSRDVETVRRDLERVRLDAERSLVHAHAPVRRVYFPESALIALSVTMADGRTAGVTIVGPEGIVGLSAAIGDTGMMDAGVLVPGVAQSMSAERFRSAINSSEAVRRTVERYAVSLLQHLAQTFALKRLNTLDKRGVRWLHLV